MKSSRWHLLRPGVRIPKLPKLTGMDRCVVLLGTGLGSGFLRPFSPSWGSLVGFAYGLALREAPSPVVRWMVAFAVLAISVPVAGRCARLMEDPDPKSVVIDEIACVPLAIWPAMHLSLSWWEWFLAFAAYRVADWAKPFPARRLEFLHGGWGIMLDDVVSALYMGALWFACLRFIPHA